MQQERRAAGADRSTRLTLVLGVETELKVERWGFEPVRVATASEAREALDRTSGPTVVLIDLAYQGLELCRWVRSSGTRFPTYVYFLLAAPRNEREKMLAGLEAGADDVVGLPLEADELRARLLAGRRILAHDLALRAERDTFQAQAMRDGLTGLYNRVAIEEILERELSRASRDGSSVGVIMADIDHFKQFNDEYGHLVGDEVLREVARRMRRTMRCYDSVGRYGGEEFLLIFPGCDHSLTLMLAERIRQVIANAPVPLHEAPFEVQVTISLGFTSDEPGSRADATGQIRAADQALYRAKHSGRNRVTGSS